MPAAARLKLTLPNDLSYLAVAQATVREAARTFGFSGEELNSIELGLEEAVTNVIQHAFELGEESTFDVVCERTPLGLQIAIQEKGLPFDPRQMPAYRPGQAAEEGTTAGMGVHLMKGVMDEVSFHNRGPEGKETRLVKYLRTKDIEKYFAPGELQVEPPAAPAPPQVIKEKIAYDVRLMQPAEAIEISKCAYKSHGYTFFDEHIYYPERIVALNESGELLSAVAVTKDNTFMGHAALHYPYAGARIAELTFVFVNVEYRGQGCMNRLVEFLFTAPKKFPLAGLYGYAVTNHPFTQKAMVKFDIQDCGLLLATSPASWVFKGIAGDNSQRLSVILSYKYMEPPQPLTLYPPARHRQMIEKLYANIHGTNRYAESPSVALPAASSVLATEVFASENCAEIQILSSGAQVQKEVKALLRDLCLKQIAAINLFLSLADPATYAVAPQLEELGFFFAGILPKTLNGDALILQYLNNVPLDYGKIVAYTPVAKELLAYVKDQDPNQT